MSSRHQKEKRLRPRNNPYKRDQFDQTKYLRVSASSSANTANPEDSEFEYLDDEYDDVEI